MSVEMAIRLSKAFASSPETLLGRQSARDLCQIREWPANLSECLAPSSAIADL